MKFKIIGYEYRTPEENLVELEIEDSCGNRFRGLLKLGDPEPSLCESNNSPQTNQPVEQVRGDISTLDASTIAHGVGKVKTVDTSKSKESKIADELNKDYDELECECKHDKNCHDERYGDCKVVGCECKKFKPRCVKTKQSETRGKE